jgi:ubiquinone/menaquinone biosynthesis C-methylase UbiE
MNYEVTRMEIFLTRLAFLLCSKSVYREFADSLPIEGGEQVLDFGCGMGTVAYYTAKRLSQGNLTCFDISERWLNECRKTLQRYDNIIFLKGESTQLKADSFDVAYCHFVLHDISESELETVIEVLARTLKPSGVFVHREPLIDTEKISLIKRIIEQNRLKPKYSRIIDVPVMGNALESVYIKL